MSNKFIDISTSNKELKNKIRQDISSATEVVYWYIRFNIPLSSDTANNDNMCVMDMRGKPLATFINYNESSNTIVINPLMPYRPNETYILTVFKEVRSSNNQPLKEDIQVVFKLKGTQIFDYRFLKGREMLNKGAVDQQRKNNQNRKKMGISSASDNHELDKLPKVHASVNFIIGIAGLLVLAGSIIFEFLIGIIISIILILAGIAHVFFQLNNDKAKAIKVYNDGVELYNEQHYQSASYRFENALLIDPDNDYALYGVARAKSRALS